MSQFDITQFENRVDTLLDAHQRLLASYRALKEAHDAERQRSRETREQLNGVIERIRALEAEADNA